MKHLFILSIAVLPLVAHSQSAGQDSVTVKELGEITVTADAQRADATKTVYFPDDNQKSTASGGIMLLSRMGIPQLSVNPINETVKTVDNQGVSLFINYHAATSEDIAGLNPRDVRRVEYLDFPVDPRFQRAPHAVNFITRTYAYGGYTKLSGKERFMISNGEASVYSKFAYRKLEYDLMVSGDYDYNSHIGSATDELYRLEQGTVRRESVTETARHRQRGVYSALRASWNKSDNLTLRSLVAYRRIHTPVSSTAGSVIFSSLYPSESYLSRSSSANNALEWNSELYASLGRGWSVNGDLQTRLLDNRTASDYMAGAESIVNNADERSWWLRGSVQANKTLSDNITLFSSVTSAGGRTRIDYTGSSNAVNCFRQTFTGLTLGISLNYSNVSGSIDGGYAFESNYINGLTMRDRYPFTHVSLQYAPNQKNVFGLWFQYATFSPDATMKNPNVIRQSEMMYIAGNPELKCSRNTSASVSYTWLPSNRWQMSAYATMFRIARRQIAVYTPDGPDGMMLKRYQNDGDYNHGQIGLKLTGKLLGGKLSLSVSPRLLLYRTTGSNSISHYPFTASASADYYLGDFFFSAYYDSESSYVDGETAFLRRMPMSCSVGAGWARRGWNIQVALVNPFRSSWRTSTDTLASRWYDSRITQFGSDYHRRLNLTVTYTLNYGRKLSPAAEIESAGPVNSSILH